MDNVVIWSIWAYRGADRKYLLKYDIQILEFKKYLPALECKLNNMMTNLDRTRGGTEITASVSVTNREQIGLTGRTIDSKDTHVPGVILFSARSRSLEAVRSKYWFWKILMPSTSVHSSYI